MCGLFWGAHKSLAPRARTLLGGLGQATLSSFAVATLLFVLFGECPKFCDLAKQRRKIVGGVSEVGKDDFSLYFFWRCVIFLVFYFSSAEKMIATSFSVLHVHRIPEKMIYCSNSMREAWRNQDQGSLKQKHGGLNINAKRCASTWGFGTPRPWPTTAGRMAGLRWPGGRCSRSSASCMSTNRAGIGTIRCGGYSKRITTFRGPLDCRPIASCSYGSSVTHSPVVEPWQSGPGCERHDG